MLGFLGFTARLFYYLRHTPFPILPHVPSVRCGSTYNPFLCHDSTLSKSFFAAHICIQV